MKVRIGFLASYNGSSMKAILKAMHDGDLDAEPAVVISNNPDANALKSASDMDIPHYCLNAHRCGGADGADGAIAMTLAEHDVDLVVLSGYMKRIGKRTLRAFPDRILNIHPSLLPQFGGPGMYGLRVHAAVLEAGVDVTGATVHLVDEAYDHGRIIAQVSIPVLAGDTPDLLRTRVAAEEGQLFVEALQQFTRRRKVM